MKLSVCIDAVCRGMDPSEALALVRSAGYNTFEFWGWRRRDLDRLENDMRRHELTLAAFCTDSAQLADPDTHRVYADGLRETVAVAERLGCRTLITTIGNELPGVPHDRQLEQVAAGLRAAMPIAEAAGVTLVLEPLNTRVDHPGYLLSRSEEAFAIVEQIGSPHLKVLYDIYHQQITEGHLIDTMVRQLPAIGHLHAAGCPGRHELQFGEIQYAAVFQALRQAGYAGAVGLEYMPSLDPAQGLADARKLFEPGLILGHRTEEPS